MFVGRLETFVKLNIFLIYSINRAEQDCLRFVKLFSNFGVMENIWTFNSFFFVCKIKGTCITYAKLAVVLSFPHVCCSFTQGSWFGTLIHDFFLYDQSYCKSYLRISCECFLLIHYFNSAIWCCQFVFLEVKRPSKVHCNRYDLYYLPVDNYNIYITFLACFVLTIPTSRTTLTLFFVDQFYPRIRL